MAAAMPTSEVGGAYHPFYGAIAQLGERDACIAEVAGSIPAGSIRQPRRPRRRPGKAGGLGCPPWVWPWPSCLRSCWSQLPRGRPRPRRPGGSWSGSRRASRRSASSSMLAESRRPHLAPLQVDPRRPAGRGQARARAVHGRAAQAARRRADGSPTPSPTSSSRGRSKTPTTLLRAHYALIDSARGPRHRRAGARGTTRTSCAKVAILDTGIDTDHPDLSAERLQERRQAEQRQGRRQERLGRRPYGSTSSRARGRARTTTVTARTCRDRRRTREQRRRRLGHLLVGEAARGEVHELEGQGLDLRRDRRDRLRRQGGLQDHQLLVRVELQVVLAARRRRLRPGPQRAARRGGRQRQREHRQPPLYPASYSDSNILTVAASTSDDTLASFSNFGADGRRRGCAGPEHLLHLHGRRLQGPVRHLDGRSLRRRGRRTAAQAGVGRHLRQPPLRDQAQGRQAACARRQGHLRRPPQRGEGAGRDRTRSSRATD